MQSEFMSASHSYVLLSDLANDLKIPAYRLRSWEVLYPFIKSFRDSSGRRFYDEKTVKIFKEISRLLYQEGRKNTEIFTIISRQFTDDISKKEEVLSEPQKREASESETSLILDMEKETTSLRDKKLSLSEENAALKEGLNNLLDSLKNLGKTIVSQEKV